MDPAQQHHERLRAATDDAHQRLAALLAASRLVERSGGALWVGPLGGALAAIDAAIAPLAAPPRHTAVAAAWPAYAELAAPLVSGAGRRPHGPGALSDELRLRALVVGWLARHAARGEPAALLGALYALAGTLRTLRAGAAAGPWGDPAPAWRAFEASVSAAPLEGGALAQAAATAQAIAGELVGLVASLDRRDPRRLSQLVGVLNPAAGNHAIPDTIEEIQAAVQAGER
ncbi:MAG TPA: hypothetical protein PKD53_11375, partial [Chloroflexaceae bacterium]|nr:hypothetical protein [Chloroflexaceae bacterium]